MKLFSGLFLYTASNFILISFQLLFQLVVLKELNEAEYGIYSSAQLLSSYILFFGLGLQTNLAVKISRSGILKMPVKQVNATLTYFLLILIAGFLSIFVFNYFAGTELNKIYLILVFLISFKGLIVQKFLVVILRTSKQIRVLSYSQIFIVLVSLLQLFFFKHLGLVFINYLLMIECLISVYLYSRFSDVKFRLNFTSILVVLKDGFNFWKVNFLFSIFPLVVASIAVKSFSLADFGYFSIFYVAINMFAKLTSSVDKINYIDISNSYPDLSIVSPGIVFRKNLYYIAISYALLLIIFLIFGELVISIFLPEKVAIYPILIISILTSAIGLLNYLNIYFDVLEKFSLKYINIALKYLVLFLFVSFFVFINKLTVLNLCMSVLFSELSAVVSNLLIMIKFRTTFFERING